MAGDDEAEPTTRDARFIKTAVEILRETGRTDFTVQEVVARSKTSLRAFYQHFSSKDELLIALLERTMALSTQALARRDERVGQHHGDQADHRSDQRRARVEHPGQPQPGDEPLQPAPVRDQAPRLRPGALPAARPAARRHPTRRQRRRLPAQPRCRARRRDRHADHLGRPAIALAGRRIDRCANRCRAPVRLLRSRARRRRERPTGNPVAGRVVQPDRHAAGRPQRRVRDDHSGESRRWSTPPARCRAA